MGYKLNGSSLSLDVAFRDSEGTQYPSNWLRGSTAAQRAAVPSGGVTWEADPPWYDQEFYWGPSKPKDIADTPTYDSYDSDGKGVGDPLGLDFGSSYDSQNQSDVEDYSGSISEAGGSFAGDDPAFQKGGLLKKKKPKVKKMKRGGLASR